MTYLSEGTISLVELMGSIAARAKWISECVTTTTYTSLTFGLVGGQIGAFFSSSLGPIVPYLMCSWIGYTYGCIGIWHKSKLRALDYAGRYPKLMIFVLRTEFKVDVPPLSPSSTNEKSGIGDDSDTERMTQSVTLDQWICRGGLGRLTWAILAAQSCHNQVADLENEERRRIVDDNYSIRD